MRDLFSSFSMPWEFWIFVGFFIGAILVSKGFRKEIEAIIAKMLGRKSRNEDGK
jgi:hypothetical protein